MKHTLGTAAKACGVGRSTILRAIKSGRMSGEKDEKGNYAIDPAELHRVFPPVVEKQTEEQSMERDATPKGTDETALLRQENDFLKQQLEREREFSKELSRRLDDEAAERRKLTALLTYQPKPEPKAEEIPEATAKKSGLYQKLFGRRKIGE